MSDIIASSGPLTSIVVALITAGKVDDKNVSSVILSVSAALEGKSIASETVEAGEAKPVKEDDIIRSLANRAAVAFKAEATQVVAEAVKQAASPVPEDGLLPYQRDGKTPAVDPNKSVLDNSIVCLDDGKSFKTLKRHIMQLGYESPEAYLQYWGLPADYPMVSPNYSAKRSEMAKSYGFGSKTNRGTRVPKAAKSKPVVKVERPDWIGPDEDIVEATVKDDYIICLIDQARPKYIRGHVKKLGMTWEGYLAKFGLPEDYPHSPYSTKRRHKVDAAAHGVEVREVEAA